MKENLVQLSEYQNWAAEIIGKIKQAQIRTTLKVNAGMLDCIGKLDSQLLINRKKKDGVAKLLTSSHRICRKASPTAWASRFAI